MEWLRRVLNPSPGNAIPDKEAKFFRFIEETKRRYAKVIAIYDCQALNLKYGLSEIATLRDLYAKNSIGLLWCMHGPEHDESKTLMSHADLAVIATYVKSKFVILTNYKSIPQISLMFDIWTIKVKAPGDRSLSGRFVQPLAGDPVGCAMYLTYSSDER